MPPLRAAHAEETAIRSAAHKSGYRYFDDKRELEAAMQAYLAFFQNNRHFFRIIFLQRSVFRDEAELRLSKKYFAHFHLFEDILTEGIERRAFKEVDVHVASFAIVGMIHALYHQWLRGGGSKKLEGNVSRIKGLVFEGLAAGQSKRESDPAPSA